MSAPECGARTSLISKASFRRVRPRMKRRQHFTRSGETFKTFCFADAITKDENGAEVVDTNLLPGRGRIGILGCFTDCRLPAQSASCTWGFAPGGANVRRWRAQGAFARCICIIAYGREPHAVTAGSTSEELEKRIAAELMEGSPALFLDNLNNTAFKSDLLASAITERPAKVRVLGRSQMVPLNACAFVILTGNGLTVSEDLARRFMAIELRSPHRGSKIPAI